MNSRILPRNLLRFSLRGLLILITIVCCIFGYATEWKARRHKHLEQDKDYIGRMQFIDNEMPSTMPWMLRLFNEPPQFGVVALIPINSLKTKNTVMGRKPYVDIATNQACRRAAALFPESIIFPVVESQNSERRYFTYSNDDLVEALIVDERGNIIEPPYEDSQSKQEK